MTIFAIKLVHTILFLILNACVIYILYSGVTGRFDRWTRTALLLMMGEGAILLLNDWRCPLTLMAEELGAADGSVSDIFLPRWFAVHLFDIYTPLFVLGCLVLIFRRMLRPRRTVSPESGGPGENNRARIP